MKDICLYELARKAIVCLSCAFMLFTNLGIDKSLGDFTRETAGSTSMYYNYPSYFTPAPYTFIIWGIIFLGAISFSVLQTIPKYGSSAQLDSISLPLASAYLVNAITPYTPIGYSNVAIGILFILLLVTYRKLNRFSDTTALNWLGRQHIVIFLAWSIVAFLLNTAQWLVSIHFTLGEYGDQLIVFLLMCSLSWVYALFFNPRKEYAFLVVLVWSFIGILMNHQTVLISLAVGINFTFLIWNHRKKHPVKGKVY